MERRRIGRKMARVLADARTELWLSPVSIWEFVHLAERQRFRGMSDPYAWLQQALRKAQWRDAPLTRDVAIEAAAFRLPHPDPSDHLIVATARAMKLTLATSDRRIIESRAVNVHEND